MSENEISSAQTFHFDFSKFLKLYMYLSDVNKINTCLCKKTHIENIKTRIPKGYSVSKY